MNYKKSVSPYRPWAHLLLFWKDFESCILFSLTGAQLSGTTLRNKELLSGFFSPSCKLMFFNFGMSNGSCFSCSLLDLSAGCLTPEGALYASSSLPISKSNDMTLAQLSICFFLSFGISNGNTPPPPGSQLASACLLLNFGMSNGSSCGRGGASTGRPVQSEDDDDDEDVVDDIVVGPSSNLCLRLSFGMSNGTSNSSW